MLAFQKPFTITIEDIVIQGEYQVNNTRFLKQPRGRTTLELIGTSRICKDENVPFEGLVFKLSKQVSRDKNDNLYHLVRAPPAQDAQPAEQPKPAGSQMQSYLGKRMKFDTFFFDDNIYVEVFHRNSPNKVNCIGKGSIELREIDFNSGLSLFSVPVYNKKLGKTVGYLYFKATFTERPQALFDMSQLEYIQHPSNFNKYEFFDSILKNQFTSECHYGFIEIKLNRLSIPHLPQAKVPQGEQRG